MQNTAKKRGAGCNTEKQQMSIKQYQLGKSMTTLDRDLETAIKLTRLSNTDCTGTVNNIM